MKTDVEVVLEARDNVVGNWCQGSFVDDDGNRCLLGHIAEAVGGHRLSAFGSISFTNHKSEFQYARIHSKVFNKLDPKSAGDWNDAPGRTEWEVYALLDDLARELKEEDNERS